MSIKLQNINKSFKDNQILKDINFTVGTGKLIALLGPSGCGKTTLLRIIAGLEKADSGKILINDLEINNKKIHERNIGFMFQNYALFKHMNVFDNIAFGLRVKPKKERLSKEEIESRVYNLLKLVQLEKFAKSYPSELSGGQKQRTALARSLATSPQLLLLDEPFAALDAKVRKDLRMWLRKKIHLELNITTILVTHDQDEALELADQIIVMNQGSIEQIGSGYELYNHPKNRFITEFFSNVNEINDAKIENGYLIIGNFKQKINFVANETKKDFVVYIRPHELKLSSNKNNSIGLVKIIDIQILGPVIRVISSIIDTNKTLESIIPQQEYYNFQFKIGDNLYIKPEKFFIYNLKKNEEYSI